VNQITLIAEKNSMLLALKAFEKGVSFPAFLYFFEIIYVWIYFDIEQLKFRKIDVST